MQEEHQTATSDPTRLYQAVARARFLIRRGETATGAAIDIGAKAFDVDERLVAEHTIRAERECGAARELRWLERQRRRATLEGDESSMIPSSLAMFDYV
ncbi:MAG: hypothetical protein NUV55_04770 [Sulfuricaulis sp.]|uniref:hypothetical protein n=1 Tax=Sulfuricaulis sp. TaxID=2003553 RepID=UPI0025DB17FA|nr:hypothetical protein [Sulfuricaulis sp.]MCR4346500.1 hypothetical protein [Sulfuricaulis sp.]